MTDQQTAEKGEEKSNQEFAYFENRLQDQQQWHENKAAWNRKRFYAVEVVALCAGALIPIINVFSILDDTILRSISAILGALIVVAVSISKLYKYQENWLSFRALAEALKREQELYMYRVGDYDVLNDEKRNKLLVESVENMLASMTSQYVSLHRSERESSAESKEKETKTKAANEAE